MSLFGRIRQLVGSSGGRQQLSSFTGQNLSGADWQTGFGQAGDHASRGLVRWLEADSPDRWTRHSGERLLMWKARKPAAYLAAEVALLERA